MNRSTQERSCQDTSMQGSGERTHWDASDDRLGNGRIAKPERVARTELSTGQMGWLVHTIECEIVPRLVRAHRVPECAAREASDADGVYARLRSAQELAQIILANETGAASAFVSALRESGVPLETVYLEVLAPAARHLGDLWTADLCDFTQVTIGLWRLQQLMYELSPVFQDDEAHGVRISHAMLVPVPGSQHTLGLLMVAQFFRRAGWGVWGDPTALEGDLIRAARGEWFDLVGFSVGAESQLPAVQSAITRIRRASRNRYIGVMVGGPVFVAKPELVAKVGADATAADASLAVDVAMRLVAATSRAQGRDTGAQRRDAGMQGRDPGDQGRDAGSAASGPT